MFNRNTGWAAPLMAAFTLALSACGGGGGSDATGAAAGAAPQSAGMVVEGTITGFGSVIIDGVRYDDSGAQVASETGAGTQSPATLADLKVGMSVEATVDANGSIATIVARATVVGMVESISAAASPPTLKVAGQTINVLSGATPTLFDGYATLADVKVGDWVEVHGTLAADHTIDARRIEHEDPARAATRVRTAGLIQSLDTAKQTFVLGDLTIDYKTASIGPADAKLDNGVFVIVFAAALPDPATKVLTAKSIRVARLPTIDGRRIHLGGLISGFKDIGTPFAVNGFPVNAKTATIVGPTNSAADLKDTVLVRVDGTIDTTASPPVIKATTITVVSDAEQREILLIGQVTGTTAPGRFTVRGTPVDASGTGVEFTGGTIADAKDGAFVTVEGHISGDVVVADEVRIQTPPSGLTLKLTGVVTDLGADGSFKLLGIPMKLGTTVSYVGGVASDLANGKLVDVKGTYDGTNFVVSEVRFRAITDTPQAATVRSVMQRRAMAPSIAA